MKTFLTEYFYYTRRERNGALALSLLCVLLFIVPLTFQYWAQPTAAPDFAVFPVGSLVTPVAAAETHSTTVDLFEFDPNTADKEDFIALGLSPKLAQTIINYRSKGGKFYRPEDLRKIYTLRPEDYERLAPYIRIAGGKYPEKYAETRPRRELFAFDPNTATEAELRRLGLPEKVALNIIKYRSKGGAFRKPEDFKKIYGLGEKDYEALAPYIRFAEIAKIPNATIVTPTKSPDFPLRGSQSLLIDINHSNIEDWQKLHGIGAAFAKRIINFREKLGGFSSVEQIAETYGLPDSTFQQIKPHLQSSPVFRRLAINAADIETLKAHPYIDARLAAAIVGYRTQHGVFSSVEDLKKIKVLSPTALAKLQPYLSFE